MSDALDFERINLSTNYGVPEQEYHFVDGSGEDRLRRLVRQLLECLQR